MAKGLHLNKYLFTLFLSGSCHSPSNINRASKLLKDQYKERFEYFFLPKIMVNDGEPMKKCKTDELFVDVALVESAEVDKDWIQSDRDHHLRIFEKIKQNITYEELLNSNDRFLLLRGIAGIGKTSLLNYLMQKWATGTLWNGKDNQPQFDFVFRFNCRELNLYEDESLSVEDLFKCHYPSIFSNICFQDLLKFEEMLLIIVDGLDEFRDIEKLLMRHRILGSMKAPTATVIQTLLNGCFPNCRRIVAGRPESVNKLYLRWSRDIEIKRADIVGFSDTMIRKYIFLFSSNANIVLQKVKGFRHLKAMSHIPVYLWIICSIFEEDVMLPAPKTMTELYIWTFVVFIREHCRNQQFSGKAMPLVSLLQEDKAKEILKVASYLSYKMLVDRKVIFTKAYIQQLGYSGSVFLKESAGFVVETTKNAVEEPIYQFGHLILQEFLCAVYCFANDISLDKQAYMIGSFDVVAPIISGLQGAMVENSQSPFVINCFVQALHKKKERRVLMIEELVKSMPNYELCYARNNFHCLTSSLFEFQNVMPKRVQEMLTAELNKARNLYVDIEHCHFLDYFIHFILNLHYTQTESNTPTYFCNKNWSWSITISNFEVKKDQLFSLSKILSELSSIRIQNARIEGVQGLAEISDTILNLRKSGEAAQKGKCIDLQKLSLLHCKITAEEITALSPVLPLLKEVNLSLNQKMGVQGYTELGKAIVKASGEAAQKGKCIDLQKLYLRNCKITAEEITALSPALSSLKEVDLSLNQEMGVQGYTELGKAIVKAGGEAAQKGKCIDLQKLYLRNCKITAEEITALSPALPLLKEIDLFCNEHIGVQGHTELGKAIVKASGEAAQKGKCIDLQKLSLKGCKITAEDITALSPALPLLKEIDLFWNEHMRVQGYTELGKAIVKASGEAAQKGKCIDLQKLNLGNCKITAEEITALSPSLPLLKEVDLSLNRKMGVQGYTELGKAIVKAGGGAAQKGKCIDLQKLSLKGCKIIAEEITALSPSLPFVKEVDLSWNEQMGVQGYTELGKAIVKASEEAAQKRKCINLQKLSLEDCKITVEEITALSPALPLLKEIDLFCNEHMGVQGYTELGKAIVKASGEAAQKGKCIYLQKLSLLDCKITAKEINALSPAVPLVKEVDLSLNTEMGVHGYTELGKAIVKASGEAAQKGKCINLQKLSLKGCKITAEEMTALSPALPLLKEIDLFWNEHMGVQGYTELGKAIVRASGEAAQKGKCIDLEKLNLRNCKITAEEITALSPALPLLKEIDFFCNEHMGVQGYTELGKAVVKASGEAAQKGKCIYLQKLGLQDCKITAEEISALSPALPLVKEVDLSSNMEMGVQGYTELGKAIVKASGEAAQKGKCIDLQKLSLKGCKITAEEITALSSALPLLKEVDLSWNEQMRVQGYTELGKAIVKASGEAAQKGKYIDLQKLNLGNCKITAEEITALSPALPLLKDFDLF